VTDPTGRPHEVRLVVEPDHVADKPSVFFCEEGKRVGARKPLAVPLADDHRAIRLGEHV
jgi:hypothetical protein